ncbi:hypothetical protein ACIQMR_14455 [Streptomyces sp. NPDC091376]|uniref:hypothetical protein n=1 Tax=Streptomyces sp. NPDC091376 TaxID=3365994 RepID=UPI003803F42D
MTFEDNLRQALRTSAESAPTAPVPTVAVIRRGGAIRRRRNAARTAGLAAAVVSCTLVTVAQLTATATTPTEPASSHSGGVRVVRAEERIDTGLGNSFWVTADGSVVLHTPGFTPKGQKEDKPYPVASAKDLKDPTLPLMFGPTHSEPGGNLYVGVYRGKGKLAKVTVEVNGVTLNATVVTLSGNPGWAAFYVNGPSTFGKPPLEKWFTGYAADGTVLARGHETSGFGAPAPAEPTVTASPAEPDSPQPAGVRVVRAEERIDAGRGNSFWVTADGSLVWQEAERKGRPFSLASAKLLKDPTLPLMYAMTSAKPTGNLYIGVYRGPHKLAKVTVEVNGVTLNAKVVTLAGNPGWAAFYVNGPSTFGGKPGPDKWHTGYAADGTVLANCLQKDGGDVTHRC